MSGDAQKQKPAAEEQNVNADEKTITLSAEQFQQLMNRVNALENQPASQPQGPTINAMGQVTGVIKHGDTNKESYNDPTDTLKKEGRLKKFFIDDDYSIEFEVEVKEWMKDGMRHVRPRFRLYVWRTVRDEEDPEKVQGYALVQRADFKDYDYQSFKNWIMTVFYPTKVQAKTNTSEMIIDGKLVEFKESEKIEGVRVNGR